LQLLIGASSVLAQVDPRTGIHKGGPFKISVSSKIRVEDLRAVIRVRAVCLPAGPFLATMNLVSFSFMHKFCNTQCLDGMEWFKKQAQVALSSLTCLHTSSVNAIDLTRCLSSLHLRMGPMSIIQVHSKPFHVSYQRAFQE
jgi:hypothetical protein